MKSLHFISNLQTINMYHFNNQRNLHHISQVNQWFLQRLEANHNQLRSWENQAQQIVAENAAIKRMVEINSIVLTKSYQQDSQQHQLQQR